MWHRAIEHKNLPHRRAQVTETCKLSLVIAVQDPPHPPHKNSSSSCREPNSSTNCILSSSNPPPLAHSCPGSSGVGIRVSESGSCWVKLRVYDYMGETEQHPFINHVKAG